MSEENSRVKLKGQSNYLEWLKRFKTMARIKAWGSYMENVFVPADGKENDALEWTVNNVSDEAMGSIEPSNSLATNLNKLNQDHGYGFTNIEKFEATILEQVDFPITMNPRVVFIWIDKQTDILISCGGRVDDILKRKIVIKGLSAGVLPKSVFVQNDFWFGCRGQLNMNNDWKYEKVKEFVW